MYIIEILVDGIIDDDLYIRPLSLCQEGQSDYVRELSEYSGKPINFMKWLSAKYYFGKVWKGKMISEFEKLSTQKFEYAKGHIPINHIHEYNIDPWCGLN